jgi:glutamate-1-semialdehyde 2,1-aminomutase
MHAWGRRVSTSESRVSLAKIYVTTASRFFHSRAHFERASATLAGGVSTAFRAVQEPVPICFEAGYGSRLVDVDGNEYIDYALGFGPMLLGHHPESVIEAVRTQMVKGLGYGACHALEADLAEIVCRAVPSAQLCVFSSTGTEAVQVALRIARACTGRRRVIKFRGHYHGWSDGIHVAVPGHLDGPGTEGQDPAAAASVTVCDWNDPEELEQTLSSGDVAAIIMEPVAVNGGCFVPAPGYLEAVRDLADRSGSLLIFDEVITGFRVGLGGAQEVLGVLPDLTILGKALGAGFPISAVCGSTQVMEVVGSRKVAHVGTFNANPVCAAAALAALTELEQGAKSIYPRLTTLMDELVSIFVEETAAVGLPLTVNHFGPAGHAFASQTPVQTAREGDESEGEAYRRFAAALLTEGIHVIPRGLLYVSTAHGDEDLERTRAATSRAAQAVVRSLSDAPVPATA